MTYMLDERFRANPGRPLLRRLGGVAGGARCARADSRSGEADLSCAVGVADRGQWRARTGAGGFTVSDRVRGHAHASAGIADQAHVAAVAVAAALPSDSASNSVSQGDIASLSEAVQGGTGRAWLDANYFFFFVN